LAKKGYLYLYNFFQEESNMKKKLVLGLVLMMAASFLVFAGGSSSGSSSGKPEINVWAGGSDNIRMLMEDLADRFNKDPKYSQICTVKVQFMPSGSGTQSLEDRLIAAYKSGQKNTTFDLVETGADNITRFLNEGGPDMFLPFEASRIPNYATVSARPPRGANLFVPYRGTTVLMIYDSARVSNPPRTEAELIQWIKDHPGRFTYNSPDSGGAGGSFVRTSIYNFLPEEALMSDDTRWMAQWDRGFNLLKEIHPYLYRSSGRVVYANRNQGALDMIANKEIDMCPMWADMALTQIKSGHVPSTVRLYQMSPSYTGSLVGFVIPSFGRYFNEAHAFIDFMLTVEAQNLSLAQNASIPMIDPSKLDQREAAAIQGLDVSRFRTEAMGALGPEINRRWNDEIATLPSN
jgi:putative spermidine/putrescine transport system substrate-binding protein